MSVKRSKRKRVAKQPAAPRRVAVVVTDDQRQCLIEDVAYFRAEHYRRVEPGRYREQDRAAAEVQIEMVLKRCKSTRGP